VNPLTVLLTNNALGVTGGSETYLRDVALALLQRGHRPVAFSRVLGPVADQLRAATIPVIDDLDRLGSVPDIIHGHHHIETLIATLRFPRVPVVHFCHGWIPWEEKPLRHPAIARYVAVDEVCADRLIREEGVAPEQVDVLLNFVDLKKFAKREPLPVRPSRALTFSNLAEQDGYSRSIRAACDAAGVSLTIAGTGSGNPTLAPEALLPQFDLVFAKGRAALESLAVGCAVVLSDRAGCGPLVTPENFDRLRPRNFGIRELQHRHDPDWYAGQIAAYDAAAAGRVSARVREEAGLDPAVDRLVEIYRQALETPVRADGCDTRAAARHMQSIASTLKQAGQFGVRINALESEVAEARRQRDAAIETASTSLAAAQRRVESLERAGEEYRALPILRLRDAVLRVPLLGAAARATTRLLARMLRHDTN
jgi:glycosyltransferase involved in cell wall biosynthesis